MTDKLRKIVKIKGEFDKVWKEVTADKKDKMEKHWDVEHAYYSATFEGNGLDKKKFESLAKEIK